MTYINSTRMFFVPVRNEGESRIKSVSLLHPLIHSVREKDSYGPKELLGRILGEIAPFLDQVDCHPLKLKLFFCKDVAISFNFVPSTALCRLRSCRLRGPWADSRAPRVPGSIPARPVFSGGWLQSILRRVRRTPGPLTGWRRLGIRPNDSDPLSLEKKNGHIQMREREKTLIKSKPLSEKWRRRLDMKSLTRKVYFYHKIRLKPT